MDQFPICRAKILYFPDVERNENRTPLGSDEFLIAASYPPPVAMQTSMYKSGRRRGRLALLYLLNWLIVNSGIDRLHLHIFARIEVPGGIFRAGRRDSEHYASKV